jgi:hypothetical protein
MNQPDANGETRFLPLTISIEHHREKNASNISLWMFKVVECVKNDRKTQD